MPKKKTLRKKDKKDKKVTILIVYESDRPTLKSLAKKVYNGASSIKGVNVKMKTINKVKNNELIKYDAVIVGSPVYNANPSPKVIDFMYRWPHDSGNMNNKIGATFVTAGGISGGEELVQINIIQAMMIFGMIIVGGSDWQSPFGASKIIEELDLKKESKHFDLKAFNLGVRVATITKNLGKNYNLQYNREKKKQKKKKI